MDGGETDLIKKMYWKGFETNKIKHFRTYGICTDGKTATTKVNKAISIIKMRT